MPDGNSRVESLAVGSDDEAFFAGKQEPGRSENPGAGNVGSGDAGGTTTDTRPIGESFGASAPAQKRRGRPPGTKNKPKSGATEENSFGPRLAVDNTVPNVAAYADAIRARHAMLGFFFGLSPDELPDENKVKALALAWVRFHQEFPKMKVSPKTEALLGMAAANSGAYLPLLMMAATKARARATAARQPRGFNIPAVNPATQDKAPDRRAAPGGEEIVLASGVQPDGGKISFE